jgi:hypothetical protein
MARTISEIKQIIITAKNNEAELFGLNSSSSTSIFNLIAYIVSVSIWTLEVLFDTHKSEVDKKINSMISGTIRWYHSIALKFQYGDALEWINDKYTYSEIDITKQIVKRVAVKEVSGQLRIKVCKESAGVPEALSVQELDSFKAYMNKIKFAGTNLSIISYGACKVNVRLNLLYNPLLLNSNGTTIINNTPVIKNAIDEYLKNIVYGGDLNKTKLIDAVQKVEGVDDVYIELLSVKEDGASVFTNVLSQNYEAVSGYYLLNTLTLIPNAND